MEAVRRLFIGSSDQFSFHHIRLTLKSTDARCFPVIRVWLELRNVSFKTVLEDRTIAHLLTGDVCTGPMWTGLEVHTARLSQPRPDFCQCASRYVMFRGLKIFHL